MTVDGDNCSVKDSYGIFAYPKKDWKFAEGCGAVSKSMKDVDVAEIMDNLNGLKTYIFYNYVVDCINTSGIGAVPEMEKYIPHYVPNGGEYKKYEDEVKPKAKKDIPDGPYELWGAVGGKYPIHMNLEKGLEKGKYYYDKNGPKATLNLSIKGFDKKSGMIVIEERTDQGRVTGIFMGRVLKDAFKGQMIAFDGRIYDIDFKLKLADK